MSGTNGNGTSGSVPFDEAMCERYLFGELSEPEQEIFETAYFSDDAFFNRFLAIKDELLDLYSRNELDTDKRRQIEVRFRATGPRRQRLAESRDFISAITLIGDAASVSSAKPAVEPKRSNLIDAFRRLLTVPAVVTVGLVVLAIGLWMISRPAPLDRAAESVDQKRQAEVSSNAEAPLSSIPSESNPAKPGQVGNEQSLPINRPDETETAVNPRADVPTGDPRVLVPSQPEVPTEPPPGPQPTPESRVAEVLKPPEPERVDVGERTESVTLSSTSRSVTKRNTASIGAATRSVIVRLLFGGGEAYASYSVRISTLGGETVWRASNITIGNDGSKSLAVAVPAASLNRRDYIVILEGRSRDGRSETIREYYLHVDRH